MVRKVHQLLFCVLLGVVCFFKSKYTCKHLMLCDGKADCEE